MLGTVLPGTGYLLAGRTRLGLVVTGISITLLTGAGYVGLARRDDVIRLAVDPDLLLAAIGVLVLLALGWIAVVVSSYRLVRPEGTGVAGRAVGSLVVGLLCFTIATGSALGTQNLMAQRQLVDEVFADGNSKSATRPQVDRKDPWAKIPRLNLLLIGADDGEGRDGARADTVMVASIDTRSGATALVSLPRNFMRMPFPKGTRLHDKYPTGYWDPSVEGEQPEFYLDAMYRNVPRDDGDLLGPSDNKGADALKLSVGAALGLRIHYYLQANLSGFEQLVTALGGITVNINYPVPVGGDDDKGIPPKRYLQPGPNRKLGGFDALWFARGRYRVPSADLARQARQRCTVKAIVERATPQNVLRRYKDIAEAGAELVRTDLPQTILPSLVTLGERVKSARIINVDLNKRKNFPNGRDPNYPAMRAIVAKAVKTQPGPAPRPTTRPTQRSTQRSTPGSTPGSTQGPTQRPSQRPTPNPTQSPTGTATRQPAAAQDLQDACAYDPD